MLVLDLYGMSLDCLSQTSEAFLCKFHLTYANLVQSSCKYVEYVVHYCGVNTQDQHYNNKRECFYLSHKT